MDDLWNSDIQNARSILSSADQHASLYTSQNEKAENVKHATIIRGKVTLLKRVINNLENIYKDFDSKATDQELLRARRCELDEIKTAYRSLDSLVKNKSVSDVTHSSHDSYKITSHDDFKHLSNDDIVEYRDAVIRMQDDELDFLDNSASAIKSISSTIRDEVNLHTRLLGDVNTSMDSTYAIVNRNRERFTEIIHNSSKRRLSFIIIVLTIILLIICFVF